MLAAVFISNVPEGLSSTAGMKKAGRGPAYVFGTWTVIAGTSINMSVVPVGAAAGAAMEIPEAFDQAGWYRFGPEPGAAAGTAVIAGHWETMSERTGFPVKVLAAGTVVQAGRQDAPALNYRVLSVELVAKDSFDGDSLFRRGGPHELKWSPAAAGGWTNEWTKARM
ncbi:hypothetical protein ABIB27_003343 [Arthrobacter sp. UYEF21]